MTVKRALVTGAASGIGLETARAFVGTGIRVFAADLDAAGLRKRLPESVEVRHVVIDLTVPNERTGLAEEVLGEGQLDYLVNAAGIARVAPVWDLALDDFRDMLAVNLEATWHLMQLLGRSINPEGSIVNLSSAAARILMAPESVGYAASKAAVITITRAFAMSLASRRVRVNALCPGLVDTPMQDQLLSTLASIRGQPTDHLRQTRIDAVPLRRYATPAECARVIQFLVSDDASYMTGQSIDLSGGLVML